MKRSIITIDPDKCTGCEQCIPGCPEGALQMIDGKARLISDLFCDGLGACIGECPEGAISIEEREAEPYDERRVMENIVKQGENTIIAHLKHLKDHNETGYLNIALDYLKKNGINVKYEQNKPEHREEKLACGCPGSMAREIVQLKPLKEPQNLNDGPIHSELTQWPVQLQLINPEAGYFKDADLLITADCVPFSYADFHRKFLKGKKLIVFCPKLDVTIDQYIEKLTVLFGTQNIRSVTILHMEVPCCFGVSKIVEQAMVKSGRHIPIEDITISMQGEIA